MGEDPLLVVSSRCEPREFFVVETPDVGEHCEFWLEVLLCRFDLDIGSFSIQPKLHSGVPIDDRVTAAENPAAGVVVVEEGRAFGWGESDLIAEGEAVF